MKLLNKPWFVGLLVVGAVAVIAYQLLAPGWKRGRMYATTQSQAAPPQAAAPESRPKPETSPVVAAETGPATDKESERKVDTNFAREHFGDWIKSAADPFALAPTIAAKVVEPSPVGGWKLKAIWHQTGGKLAAINKGVYREGDEIQGYKIEKIETDQVWFRGKQGKESLGFAKPEAKGTNSVGTASLSSNH